MVGVGEGAVGVGERAVGVNVCLCMHTHVSVIKVDG